MAIASTLNEASKKVKPVFDDVPKKLRDFASKTMNVVEATAKVSIRSMKDLVINRKDTRSNPLDLDAVPDKNIGFAINWIVDILKNVLSKLDEQGDIIRVHTEVLAKPEAAMDVPSSGEVDALKKDNDKLRIEVDETRQRGMKGNIIVSCPARNNKETLAVPQEVKEGEKKRLESETEMVLRLIEDKTGVTIPLKDVVACHPMGLREKNTFVVRIINRKPGSAWEGLVECMMKASLMDKTVSVYLNFQMTNRRAALAKAVRVAKTESKIAGYSVDQNGRVKIKKNNEKRYETVTSVEHLNGMIVA